MALVWSKRNAIFRVPETREVHLLHSTLRRQSPMSICIGDTYHKSVKIGVLGDACLALLALLELRT